MSAQSRRAFPLDEESKQTFALIPPRQPLSCFMASVSQVVVVGSIMQDLTLACAEFPQPGETIVGQLRTGQGGKGSNQAIACGKTGVRTIFVGAMGDDAYARAGRGVLSSGKDRLPSGAEDETTPTGTAVILINGRGQNEIVIEPGANAALRAEPMCRRHCLHRRRS
ncbi:MAG: PfkB family carbohydrate kinase [Vicinamibacterales bacterium]